jgi:GT2 family glycosyltransferase
MKITMIIVLYKLAIEESKTVKSLKKALANQSYLGHNLELLLYDNSPEMQDVDPDVFPNIKFTYIHDKRNLGIATAYNFAFNMAKENGSNWLLLFDHDTEVTEDYVKHFGTLQSYETNVAAVVPIINYENTIISPVMSNTLRPLQAEKPSAGFQQTPVMAINSGSLIRVEFLKEIDGFNNRFPLDYLDHWLFYEIYARGYYVHVLNTTLEHELSVMDYSRVSITRYQSILNSEILFYKEYKKELLSSYKIQLVKRLLKQVLLVKDKKIAVCTLRRLLSL